MICFLPHTIDDELLYGWLARHRRAMGSDPAAVHMEALLGRRTVVATVDLPGHLEDLCSRFHPAFGITARDLLLRNTLYPYYAAFQPAGVRAEVEAELLAGHAPAAHLRLGVAAFRVPRGRRLRYCPECLTSQVEDHGTATWMRRHQLPGNVLCPEHECVLLEGDVALNGLARHGFRYLDAASAGVSTRLPDPKAVDILTSIAKRQATLVQRLRDERPLGEWKRHYREALARVGLMRSPCKVDNVRLAQAVVDTLGPALPLLPTACSTTGDSGWAALMVREHRKAMHPLFHVMMELLLSRLNQVPNPVEVPNDGHRRSSSRPDRSANRIAVPRCDWLSRDAELLLRLDHANRVIRACEPPCRVSFAALERQAAGAGWLRKRSDKLPSAMARISELEETDSDFRRRRVAYWAEHMPGSVPWRIFKAAGIRSQFWREAMSDLVALRLDEASTVAA